MAHDLKQPPSDKAGAASAADQAALRSLLASIVESSEDAVFTKDLNGVITSWNQGAECVYGFTAVDAIGQPVSMLIPESQSGEFEEMLEKVRRGERVEHFTTVRQRKDGRRINVSLSISPVRDAAGEIIGSSCIARDITAEIQDRRQLTEAHQLLESIFENTHLLLAYLDPELRFVRVNRAYAAADHNEPSYYPGKAHFDLFPNDENEKIFKSVVETGEPHYEAAKPFTYAAHPERGVSYWDWSLTPVFDIEGKVSGVILSLQDVSERLQSEVELIFRENRLKEAQRLAHVGHWELDLENNTLDWSDEVYRIFGLEPQEFGATYEAFLEHVHPDDRDYVNESYQESLSNRTGYDIEHRVVRKDGSLRYVNERCDTEYDEDGNPLRSMGTVLDVTERRLAEDQLRLAVAYNRSLIEANLDPQVTIETGGKITDVNTATEVVTGRSRAELIGTDFSDYFTEPDKARAGYKQVFREGSIHDYALHIRHKDGHITPVLYNSSIYRDETGEVVGVFAAARDITERLEAESALRQSRQKTLDILESISDGFFTLDRQWRFTYLNSNAGQLMHRESEQLLGRIIWEEFPEAVNTALYKIYHQTMSTGSPSNFEEYYQPLDLWYEGTAYPYEDGLTVFFRDVSERKRAEEELKRAGAYNRSLIEVSLDPLVTIDISGKITDVNAATEKVTGLPRGLLIGTDFSEYFTDSGAARAGYRQVFREGFVHDYPLEIRRTDGHVTPVLYNASVYRDESGDVVGVFAAARDVTERQKAETALRRSNRALKVLSDCNEILVRAVDETTLLKEACDILVQVGGYQLAWVGMAETDGEQRVRPVSHAGLGSSYLEGIDITWSDTERGRGPTGRAIRERRPVVCRDIRANESFAPWRDEALRRGYQSSISLPLAVEQDVIGALQVFSDQPDAFNESEVGLLYELANDIAYGMKSLRVLKLREQAEKSLIASEAKYRNIFEGSRETIFITTPEGRVVDVNPAGIELFGYGSKESMSEINVAREIYADAADRKIFLESMEREGYIKDYEMRLRRKDGAELNVLVSASCIRDENGVTVSYSGIMHDMTERRRLEEQLYRSQRLESVGRLAGGVAHDFNNFLTAIKGYIDLALGEVSEGSSAREDLVEAGAAADRAAALTRQLLIFSRRESMEFKPLDLNAVVREILNMLGKLIGERFTIEVDLADSLPRVNADAGHLEQVLMNLVVNAKDAMAEGGAIRISTADARVGKQQASEQEVSPGNYVVLRVKDNGCGMDQQTLSRIFEPFYSNKPGTENTGLGLSLVYGITRQHGGFIEVESTPGEWSVFSIYFPAITSESEKAESCEAQGVDTRGQGERVMVVEDEDQVRGFLTKVLEKNGYEVLEAGSAEDALELFARDEGKIAAVCSDVVLPGKDGIWLAEQVRAKNPDVRIILASGYNQPDEQRAIMGKGYRFVPKPYSSDQLLAVIRDVIDNT